MTSDPLRGLGVEIEVPTDDEFLKIRETLTRMGVASGKTLTQSCHILHKQGRYAIVHFKEMFVLDGKESTLTAEDLERRDAIAHLLADWKLVTIKNPPERPTMRVTVIPFKDKGDWTLAAKYEVGRGRKSAVDSSAPV